MTRVRPIPVIAGLGLGGLGAVSALIASATRADFVFRGCPDMPSETWGETVNCADGWLGQWLFGTAAVVCLGLAGLLMWRGVRA